MAFGRTPKKRVETTPKGVSDGGVEKDLVAPPQHEATSQRRRLERGGKGAAVL
ncbi:hypothetical protein A2U01_0025333 [Trifolium medium]|uniref:Uncharacterized protein n=1 Tax=Trifolium medium TaxID=97028 RepID=A0A392NYV7_9FABA|nr:hypothetical protein [Trifolium medium]